ncbi:hypothetical protein [Luteolibacter luteus]|uniref:Uncharacterized protein n=1 Tax=Luteolibacter luteus TaxID=2728835 RepID=A0A858RHJ8_9BACT|nr:hypothetical protein [Luteolibacter luteus]QJE95988.1 hypothetical protein HHL09_09400 [Luteolibacter luteus]
MKLAASVSRVNPGNVSTIKRETDSQLEDFLKEIGFGDIGELEGAILKAGIQAVLDQVKANGELTVPLSFAVVPSGKGPLFLKERTVRYMRECCAIAGVDLSEWAEKWIGDDGEQGQVHDALSGRLDVAQIGLCHDIVVEEVERTTEEEDALFERMREVAFRYQQELKQEAAASVEGGEE